VLQKASQGVGRHPHAGVAPTRRRNPGLVRHDVTGARAPEPSLSQELRKALHRVTAHGRNGAPPLISVFDRPADLDGGPNTRYPL
jgi:hypothetical protein